MRMPGPSVLALLIGALLQTAALAASPVSTNQSYVEEAMRPADFDIADVKAVFGMVLASLPERVTVYPTENYYYFSFLHGGVKYAGNFRFDIGDRDKGVVHFNYFKEFSLWHRDETDYSAALGRADGVSVAAAGALAYRVDFAGTSVLFQLNDLTGAKPPPGATRADETYIGPVFDESGLRFFLLFNRDLKIFMFVLDETVPVAEQFVATESGKSLSIGVRSGFAFHADAYLPRKILVAVNQYNTAVNNYFDGPFDQLPDNFIEGEALREAIVAASPEMKGEIDRFGNSPDGLTRYLVAPYYQYEDPAELSMIQHCADQEQPPIYYNCFSFVGYDPDDDETDEP